MTIITVERRILEKNDEVARRNRARLEALGLFTINLVSSPGAGKTTLLERTLERLKDAVPLAVIEGDVQTDLDARRVDEYQVPVVQIVTRGGCHLDAALVADAMEGLDLATRRLLIIENVGNLVCPAAYDLGETARVVVLSVTEGDDKPLKYPAMFRNSELLLVNKVDLLPYVDCDLEALKANAREVNPDLRILELSARTGEGVDRWCDWLTRHCPALPA